MSRLGDLRLNLGVPRRVYHGRRLHAQFGAGEGELDLARGDLHGQLAVLLQPLPDLMPVPPQRLESEDGVDSLVGQLVIHLRVDQGRRVSGDLDAGDDKDGGGGPHDVPVRLPQQLPGHRQDVDERVVGQDAGALVQNGQRYVEEVPHSDLEVLQHHRRRVHLSWALLADVRRLLRLSALDFLRFLLDSFGLRHLRS